jgi:hypothetical protein
MSATVVREPQAWTKTVARLKADIVAGREDAEQLTPNLKIGVSTNLNKLVSLGWHLGAACSQLPSSGLPILQHFNRTCLLQLRTPVR